MKRWAVEVERHGGQWQTVSEEMTRDSAEKRRPVVSSLSYLSYHVMIVGLERGGSVTGFQLRALLSAAGIGLVQVMVKVMA
ncbi:unnamed protein product [Lota lota]